MRVRRPGSPQPGRFLLPVAPPAPPPLRELAVVGDKYVVDELPRRVLPAVAKRVRPSGATLERKGCKRRGFQIPIQDADVRLGEHVLGPARRKGSDRNAARQSLEQHEAE